MKTKIINFFAGPGAGKSTTSAGLFYELKLRNYNVEYVSEFAKDLTWSDRHNTLACQSYVFGKQLWRIERLIDKVDYIVTDSPLILSAIYNILFNDPETRHFENHVLETFNKFDNYNYFINRTKEYNPKGRNQTEEESKNIDFVIKNFLNINRIPFTQIMGERKMVNRVLDDMISSGLALGE